MPSFETPKESRALCIKLAQLKRELHIGKQQVPVFCVFSLRKCRVAIGLNKTASFGKIPAI